MKYNIKITPLSPVHIGTGESLDQKDFYNLDDSIYIIDQRKFIHSLIKHKKIDDFQHFTEGGQYTLDSFFKHVENKDKRQGVPKDLKTGKIVKKREKDDISNFQPFISTLWEKDMKKRTPYIPGSSLKGAIRMAFIEEIIKAKNITITENTEGKYIDNLLNEGGGKASQDWLKFLRVSDFGPLKVKDEMELSWIVPSKVISCNYEKDDFHYSKKPRNKKDILNNVEALKEKVPFTGTIAIDEKGISVFIKETENKKSPIKDLDHCLDLCKKRTSRIIDEEIKFFKSINKENQLNHVIENLEKIKEEGANLRLGWGSGILSTTETGLLSPEERIELRSKRGRFNKRSTELFPQSRKVMMEEALPGNTFGWVKIEIL